MLKVENVKNLLTLLCCLVLPIIIILLFYYLKKCKSKNTVTKICDDEGNEIEIEVEPLGI